LNEASKAYVRPSDREIGGALLPALHSGWSKNLQ